MKVLAFIAAGLFLIGTVSAADRPGDGTLPLRVANLENDVAEIKSGLERLLAQFEAEGQTPTKSILKAPRRPQAAPKRKVSHHRPATTCAPPRPPCPPPIPMTTCAPRTTCGPVVPMTTCAPRTTCSPRRVIYWCR